MSDNPYGPPNYDRLVAKDLLLPEEARELERQWHADNTWYDDARADAAAERDYDYDDDGDDE